MLKASDTSDKKQLPRKIRIKNINKRISTLKKYTRRHRFWYCLHLTLLVLSSILMNNNFKKKRINQHKNATKTPFLNYIKLTLKKTKLLEFEKNKRRSKCSRFQIPVKFRRDAENLIQIYFNIIGQIKSYKWNPFSVTMVVISFLFKVNKGCFWFDQNWD